MAISKKINTGADVIIGLATVNCGVRQVYYDPSPSGGMGAASKHLGSGDSLAQFVALDGRYKVGVASGVWE